MPEKELHPTVAKFLKQRKQTDNRASAPPLDAGEIKQMVLSAGADDAGFVKISRPEIDTDRMDILEAFPRAKTLISFACKMRKDNIRTPARSVANLEFHMMGDHVNETAGRIVNKLEEMGFKGINGGSMGFPMDMSRFPGKLWVVSHKLVAEAAGLGKIGIHRNLIHPRFGSFINLGTVVTDAEIPEESRPLDYNPCMECKLCVSACPVGAISPEGKFNFSACITHNYREFLGGFKDFVETIVGSRSVPEFRKKVSTSETVSWWQSLSFGANYKASYCLAVCPAGDDVAAPYLTNRSEFIEEVVRPFQAKKETVYVVPGSDAETTVPKRFPNKTIKRVGNGLIPPTIDAFIRFLPLIFQPLQSKGLDALYHFTFTGEENRKATFTIRNQEVSVEEGHIGKPNLSVKADSRTWLRFLAKEISIVRALVTFQVRLKGNPRLLIAFGKCFPF